MKMEMSIGRLAQAADVNVETIRYYQRRGLLDEPDKPLGGHRRYSEVDARRVRFIKRAQALGFTLTDIAGLLHLDNACACRDTHALAVHKLTLIEQKIADLDAMKRALGDLVQQCQTVAGDMPCPIIGSLGIM